MVIYYTAVFRGSRSTYQYSNLAPMLSVQASIFVVSFIVSKSSLRDKRNFKTLQFGPESLAAMLEYLYNERGLLCFM